MWIAGFGAAIATIIGWSQLALAAANPHAAAYASLARLGTGVTVDHVRAVLGEPAAVVQLSDTALVAPVGGTTDLEEQLFLQERFVVTVLIDSAGEVQLYTVLSCDPSFRPTFLTPGGSTVRLNDKPLAEADTSGAAPETTYLRTDVHQTVQRQLLDVMRATGDGSSRYRGYALGISELCSPLQAASGETFADFVGSVDGLDAEPSRFRREHPANFYVEVGTSWTITPENVALDLPSPFSIPAGYLRDTFGY